MTTKETAVQLIQALPDDTTWEEILKRISAVSGAGGQDRAAATPGALVGLFPPEDLDAIEATVRDCRKVDPDGW